jgi:hypothetical protein
LQSATRALAIEFAIEYVRFNAIAPGVMNTPMNPVHAHDFLKELGPLRRLARVEEVAALLLYLESTPFVNGQVVHLDRGAHAGQWSCKNEPMKMWPNNRILDLFRIDVPIIQAPMAGSVLSEMVVAVSEAGGLGSLPCALLSLDQMRNELEAIRRQTKRPIHVNFFCHTPPRVDANREALWRQRLQRYYLELGLDQNKPVPRANRASFDENMCDLVVEFHPEVVSFHFGLPEERLLRKVQDSGAKIVSSATSVDEARWLSKQSAADSRCTDGNLGSPSSVRGETPTDSAGRIHGNEMVAGRDDSQDVSIAVSLNPEAPGTLVLDLGNSTLTRFAVPAAALHSELSTVFQCNGPAAMPPIPGDTRSEEPSGSGLVFENSITITRTRRDTGVSDLPSVCQHQGYPRKLLNVSNDEHIVGSAAANPKRSRSQVQIPLGAFKTDRNSVVRLQINVGAVVDSGPNIEGIGRFDSETAPIFVEFEWFVYLSRRERRKQQKTYRNQN